MIFSKIRRFLANQILNRLFLNAPEMEITEEKRQSFESLIHPFLIDPNGEEINYQVSYPKQEFLRYLVSEKQVLLHGSNHSEIEELKPRSQSDWNGKPIEAVFASGDGIWPMFFAVVQHQNYHGSYRNGCFLIRESPDIENRYYFFSLNRDYQVKAPWQNGMIYILPKKTFHQTASGTIRFDEWASLYAVKPIAKLSVSPKDFPFYPQVTWHNEQEKIYTTWLKFKKRIST